jgi:tetrahydromethanopterin S-methyltransferase subunit H
MDQTGDSRHVFDRNDAEALARAEERFKDLTGRGFTAAVREDDGQSRLIRVFDPAAEETLFFPRLVGG